jgi:hypothetical protein
VESSKEATIGGKKYVKEEELLFMIPKITIVNNIVVFIEVKLPSKGKNW